MKSLVDPKDCGLPFCLSKAHLQTNGGILTTEKNTSQLSQEVGKQDKCRSSGVARVKSLESALQELKVHMTKRPLDYWMVYDDDKNQF